MMYRQSSSAACFTHTHTQLHKKNPDTDESKYYTHTYTYTEREKERMCDASASKAASICSDAAASSNFPSVFVLSLVFSFQVAQRIEPSGRLHGGDELDFRLFVLAL